MSQQINLFNPLFRKQKKHLSAAAMLQSLGLVLLGLIALAAYADYQLARLAKETAAGTAQQATAQMQLDTITQKNGFKQKSKQLELELQKAEVEVRSLQQISDTLQKGELGNTKGYSEYLRAFSRQIVGGLWLTGFSIYGAGNEVGLQGRALQPDLVPAYISRLKREPIMQGKSFTNLLMQAPQVEQAEQIDKTNSVFAKRIPAGYVEFNLQSSGAAMDNEQSDPSGVKSK